MKINDGPDSSEMLKKAARSAVNILSYADNTEARLRDKLRQKGYCDEAVDYAVEYVKQNNLLSDQRMLEHAVFYLAERKLFGMRRIFVELNKKGFSSEMISEADFSGIDFKENCRKLFIKQGGVPDLRTRNFLYRYGYNYNEVRYAFERADE